MTTHVYLWLWLELLLVLWLLVALTLRECQSYLGQLPHERVGGHCISHYEVHLIVTRERLEETIRGTNLNNTYYHISKNSKSDENTLASHVNIEPSQNKEARASVNSHIFHLNGT